MTEGERTFHLPVMTQVSAGGFWNDAPSIHRRALIAAFAHYAVSLLARNFSGDGITRFETIGERPGPRNTALVDARIACKNGSDIEITHALKTRTGSWRVADVVLDEGTSELALRQSEFSHQLVNAGLPALTSTLNGKADEFADAAGATRAE
ncbi:MAG: ABC transporter substrate-binding protein [Rhodospirillales bacterium]|nr:ABC transporter substrate-binding protein [Rhodospirillales bacterium]